MGSIRATGFAITAGLTLCLVACSAPPSETTSSGAPPATVAALLAAPGRTTSGRAAAPPHSAAGTTTRRATGAATRTPGSSRRAPSGQGSTRSAPTAPSAPAAGRVMSYANCTALHVDHPHGVGRPGAHDHGPHPVTTFTVSAALYRANTHLDRDRDGVACERA
jgi:Excalibur calcium-binding domain